MQPCARCTKGASGVEPKAAPGGQDGQICGMSDGGIDAGEAGGREPPRRLSGGRCGRSRRQSCAARCRRRGRKCPHSCGHNCTARCGAKCGRAPQERPHECSERGAGRDECCAKRRREEIAAVVPSMPSNVALAVAGRHAVVSVSEPPGKRSAQRPKGAEARGIPARRGETAQRARQGSPVAKRRAQPHRQVTRKRIQVRHHRLHDRLHLRREHRSHQRQNRRHRERHRHRHHHRHRRRCVPDIVVGCREVVRRESGGAAAERGAAGDARSEGGPCGWRRVRVRPKKKGRAAEATRPVVAMRATRPPAAPGFRARRPCRPGCR